MLRSVLALPLCLALVALPCPARADAPAAAAPEAATEPCPPAMSEAAQAQMLYDLALELMAAEAWDGARFLLTRVITDYRHLPVAADANLALSRLPEDALAPAPVLGEDDGRAELIVAETLLGTGMGLNFIYLIGADDPAAYAGGALAGAAGGLVGTMLATRERGVTKARAQSIYWGQVFTTANLTLTLLAIDPSLIQEKAFAISNTVGFVGGIPLGRLYQEQTQLTSGQVGLVTTAGLWGGYFAEMVFLSLGEDAVEAAGGRLVLLIPLLGMDASIAGATLAMRDYPISRSRVRLVNLGGYMGALVAGAGLIIVQPDLDNTAALTVPLILGPAAGMVVAWQATRNWDRQRHPELFTTTPVGALLGVQGGKVRLDGLYPTPTATPWWDADGGVHVTPGLRVGVIAGTF